MSIYLIDQLKQKNAAKFPLLEDIDLEGGFRTFLTTAERNDLVNFPTTYRKIGMFVWTEDTAKLWRLSGWPNTWTEFAGGGVPSGSAIIDSSLIAGENLTAGYPVAIGPAGTLLLADAHESDPTRQEVHGLAASSVLSGNPVDVTMAGVLNYVSGFAIGTVLYLGLGTGTGGGISTTPPIDAPGRKIVRIGQVRSASTLMVRVQVIAEL